jgi:hypothetical protein
VPDRQTQAVLALWARQVAAGGRDVVGATSVGPIKAVKGGVLLKLSDPQGGVRMLRTQDDYLLLASDLAELGEPEEADRVQDLKEGRDYEVRPPDDPAQEAAWRYTDSTHALIRLHTRGAAS